MFAILLFSSFFKGPRPYMWGIGRLRGDSHVFDDPGESCINFATDAAMVAFRIYVINELLLRE
jgi:hypothetical protein